MSRPDDFATTPDYLLRTAVICTIVGLASVLLFLWEGFAWYTVGVGIFFGIPMLIIGIGTYLVAVIRDLRRRGAL